MKMMSTTTVDKRLAHKWAIGEVLLTSFEAVDENSMRLTAYLPQSHFFYNDRPGSLRTNDFAVIVEACRQACFLVAHELLQVPKEQQFLLKSIEAALVESRPMTSQHEIEIAAVVRGQRFRGSSLSGMFWDFSVSDEDGTFATASFEQTWIDRTPWRQTRELMRVSRGLEGPSPFSTGRLVPPTDPASVGRAFAENVVIGDPRHDQSRWTAQASLTTDHPTLFDHPIDHVYGMVQLEMARQLCVAALSRSQGLDPQEFALSATKSEYMTTGELDLPLDVVAELPAAWSPNCGEPAPVELQLWQAGRQVSSFTQHYRVQGK